MSVLTDTRAVWRTLARAVRRRRNWRIMNRMLEERGPLPVGHFEAVLYFPDTAVNLYQARQWYEPLRQLAEKHPVVILARSPKVVSLLLEEAPLPVHHVPNIAAVEMWLEEQPVGAMFYVNQNVRNFSALRFPGPAHVFLNHGESDKSYMASNQAKAYDHVFVAGQAAVDRIAARLYGYDLDRLRLVGRPQVDVPTPAPAMPVDDRTVVFYAPTWEGDRPSMQYSSVQSHAPALLGSLLATGRHRVIVRAHPRTGAYDRTYRETLHALGKLIKEANRRDPGAQHIVDDGPDYGWQMSVADVCVTDVSAVVFDWLVTGKPLLLTRPASLEADFDLDGVAGKLPLLSAEGSGAGAARIDALVAAPEDPTRTALIERHFGDTTPGASMGRFLDAATEIIERRRPQD